MEELCIDTMFIIVRNVTKELHKYIYMKLSSCFEAIGKSVVLKLNSLSITAHKTLTENSMPSLIVNPCVRIQPGDKTID